MKIQCPRCEHHFEPPKAAMRSLRFGYGLTQAQGKVADLAAQGLSNWEISQHLGTSEGYVKNTMVKVLNQLGVRSRVEVALVAAGIKEVRRELRGVQPAASPASLAAS